MDFPVRYALLRDDLEWEGARTGLALAADGTLALARVPAPVPGAEIAREPRLDEEPSGLTTDERGWIIVANTRAHCIIVEQPACRFRYALPLNAAAGNAPGQFHTPSGVAVVGDTLYVADRANARVQCFLLPTLELRRIINAGLSEPAALAVDHALRLYVLDRRDPSRILRFRADGSTDDAYNTALAAAVTQPAFLALDADDALYVSDEATNTVRAFDPDGHRTSELVIPSAMRPRALAVRANEVLVADAASGSIMVFDAASGACLGSIPGFRAAVSAIAFDSNGDLLVKTDTTEGYARLRAAAGCLEAGTLVAGPLDAGVEQDWERVAVDATRPGNASVTLQTCTRDLDHPAPVSDNDWTTAPSTDCLLARDPGPAEAQPGKRRFLWVRVRVTSADRRASAKIAQVRAQTVGDSYLDELPRIYARNDRDTRFLERWLALFRSSIEASEEEIERMPRRFDPIAARARHLRWLAEQLAFDAPHDITPDALRTLLARVPQLYAQRGTVAGLEAFAEIHTGIRPKIIEAYHARRVWQLGETSLLGFDTALAAATPEGFVVPKNAVTDPRYAGLHGDYYKGVEFDELVRAATDETIDFNELSSFSTTDARAGPLKLSDDDGISIMRFSVRWSGQIKPRFSETYTFHVEHRDGTRLWIDGKLLIDEWGQTPDVNRDPRTVLDADRWHAIQLEIRSLRSATTARLLWSSRSQRKEPVPRECLYSVLDEHADLSASQHAAFDVGHAVVGESGPLAASEFGSTLFTDYAHLFTVIAPAGHYCDRQRRETLRDVIDAEKPAYTDYHLCFVEPRMRVGFQARLGIDAIVAHGPSPLRLDETLLGRDSFLADALPGGARVGTRGKLGQDTVLG